MSIQVPMGIEQARRSFFLEDEVAEDRSGFVKDGWRGAVLGRDKYDWHAMPRFLWETLQAAAGDSRWWICGYAAEGAPPEPAVSFSFDWDAFLALPDNPARESPEWVAYNESQTIAILAEFDVTVVGASRLMADNIDMILRTSNSSLREMTWVDFPEPGRLAAFIKAVTK